MKLILFILAVMISIGTTPCLSAPIPATDNFFKDLGKDIVGAADMAYMMVVDQLKAVASVPDTPAKIQNDLELLNKVVMAPGKIANAFQKLKMLGGGGGTMPVDAAGTIAMDAGAMDAAAAVVMEAAAGGAMDAAGAALIDVNPIAAVAEEAANAIAAVGAEAAAAALEAVPASLPALAEEGPLLLVG